MHSDIVNRIEVDDNVFKGFDFGEITDLANLKKGVEILRKLDSFMGIIPKREIDTDSEAIEVLIGKRNVFRAERNWIEADSIRNSLLDMGVMLEDKKEGTRWWRKGKIV